MEDHNEPEVTLESIDSALDNLVKAAEATDLAKAYGGTSVETYGRVDENGKSKGTLADKGDIGGLDSMMIGKMEQSLVEQGFPAAAIAAFMRGKQEEEDDDDGDEDGGKKKPPFGKSADHRPTPPPVEEHVSKSFDAFTDDPAIADAIDVSPYLEALVQRTCEQLDGLGKSMSERGAKQDEVNKSMAVAVYGMGQLVKSIAAHATRLDQRLGLVEAQPNAPKGHTQLPTGARPMAKSFGHHGVEGQGGEQSLTKSMVLSTLSYLNLEKGVREIGGRSTSELIGLYEGGNQLAPQALHAVKRFLATNPGEANVAVTYR